MKKIDVVILHYNNLDDTTRYIENLRILNWTGISHHFIIVDNASPNGSGQLLPQLYRNDPEVVVLQSPENLGFAKGNNLGIVYASAHFDSDFIAVSNNDIEITDKDFFQKLLCVYAEDPFAVCGPDIYSASKQFHQSPIRTQLLTLQEVEDSVLAMSRKLKQVKLLRDLHLYEPLRKLNHLLGRKSGGIVSADAKSIQHNVVVHGAFFVLTKTYMDHFPYGLYPETFMYQEEDILAYLCLHQGLTIRYSPELQVLHYDGVSTLKATGNRANKYIFELTNTIQSSQVLITLMKRDGNEGN